MTSKNKILIYNNVKFHYEIIESVIVKYDSILNIKKNKNDQLYLYIIENNSFSKYIKTKYPNIIFVDIKDHKYNYSINCTIYDKDFNELNSSSLSKQKYISHEITDRLKTNKNVFFLTPLAKKNIVIANILPFTNTKIHSNVPIYIIQGNLNHGRRNLSLLKKILDKTYAYNFIIKMVGNGSLPVELIDYQDKIVLRNNLDFQDFHKEFLDAYCILPLITKTSHIHYYTDKLTSTINYADAYKLKCLIDKDLQNIYNLKNVEVFNNIDDITVSFEKTLKAFYGDK